MVQLGRRPTSLIRCTVTLLQSQLSLESPQSSVGTRAHRLQNSDILAESIILNKLSILTAFPISLLMDVSDVDESLSDKVAMFNQYANKHKDTQSKNPFTSGLNIEKRKFSKEEYGRPQAGSLTDIRGRKAAVHIMKEVFELCQIIHEEGTPCRDQPEVIAITFGDLFNIYTHISNKCVGLLLRARKQKLVDFEGEVLFQRRDDDVPIYLIKPIKEIRELYNQRVQEIAKELPTS